MALTLSPQIVTNGLVFAYDMANIKKSWKGKPTTNIIGNGCFAGGAGIENEYGSYGTNNIVMLLNPGNTPYVLRQGPGGGEYEIHPKAGYAASLNANTTYCMSIWVAYTPDWNGNSMTLHSRWYDGAGNPYTTATDGTVIDTLNLDLVWQRRYTTFTTPSTVSGLYQWYLGYPTDNTTGFRYITGVQLEEGTFPTAFVDGTRSNTQAILDLTNNNTITASSLTYNSDGTFNFNGSSNYITTTNTGLIHGTGNFAYSCWLKFSGLPGLGTIFENGFYTNGILIRFETNLIHVYCEYAATSYNSTMSFTPTIGLWYNLVLVRVGDMLYLYINGTQTSSVAFGTNINVVPSNNLMYIGMSQHAAGQCFNGIISNASVYNRALSAAEVKQNFNALRSRFGI